MKRERQAILFAPAIRIASVEELTFVEKSNLLICEEELEGLDQFLECREVKARAKKMFACHTSAC